jgi:hypothetical protein
MVLANVSLDDDSGRRQRCGSLDLKWCDKGSPRRFPFRECVKPCGSKQRQCQQDGDAGQCVHGVVVGHGALAGLLYQVKEHPADCGLGIGAVQTTCENLHGGVDVGLQNTNSGTFFWPFVVANIGAVKTKKREQFHELFHDRSLHGHSVVGWGIEQCGNGGGSSGRRFAFLAWL